MSGAVSTPTLSIPKLIVSQWNHMVHWLFDGQRKIFGRSMRQVGFSGSAPGATTCNHKHL